MLTSRFALAAGRRPVAWYAAVVLVLGSASVLAQSIDPGEGPFLLTADEMTYDEPNAVVTATGDVEVSRGARRLLADRLVYHQAEDRVEAIGNVILIEPTGETLFADQVTLTGDLREGAIDRLRVLLADNARATAASGTREAGNVTVMKDVTYSPCQLCEGGGAPPWQLRAETVTHDQTAKTLTYNNAFFDILGVPVAYTPYFTHPDPTVKRKSGFLAPSYANDSELGLTLSTPYFFNLAPNRDFTFEPVVTSEGGQVLGGEFRELRPSGEYRLRGSIVDSPGGFDDNDRDGIRGTLGGEGEFEIDNERRWGFDGEWASDRDYLRNYNFDSSSLLTSRLYAERTWSQSNYAGINAYAFQGLREDDEQDLIPVALPLAEMRYTTEPLAFGGYVETDGNLLGLTREDGLDTRRLTGSSTIVVPRVGPLGTVYNLRAGLRGDVYYTTGDTESYQDEGGDNVTGRMFPELSVDWSWPLVADVGGISPIIEPVVMAAWTPDGLNQDSIPNEDSLDFEFDTSNLFSPDRFPGYDRVEEGARVAYGLKVGAYGVAGGTFSAIFGQGYNFSNTEAFRSSAGVGDGLSDYVGRIDLQPSWPIDLSYRFRLDQDNFQPVSNELRLATGPANARFDLGYLYLDDESQFEDDYGQRKELTAGLTLGITPEIAIRARTRQDLEESQAISNELGITYTDYCFVLAAGIERSVQRSTDESAGTTIGFRVALRNLGEWGGGGRDDEN
ncbi:LPS-assembly protein LptD [Marinivivus vitaminiproducens]|uniref:LPS-assembly protein LptD n=1 Tax=Marinivivus vitaminiproducens TaxID=3035935 RepID=UPI0027A17E71|nr:LPS assembly protein LptD [Geminicoccaceae bacterium SCSIO 64248]